MVVCARRLEWEAVRSLAHPLLDNTWQARMIQYSTMSTALARCPVEIWCEILRYATEAEGPDMLADPMSMERFYLEGTYSNAITEAYEDRLNAMTDMRNFSTVCRLWHEILHPLRARWVIINQRDQMKGVSDTVSRLCRHRRVGRWTKRLEVRARITHGEMMEPLHGRKQPPISRLLQHSPQLEEFISLTSALHYPALCSDLIVNCGRTLKTVVLRSSIAQRFDDIVNLLLYCPRLEYLHFSGPRYDPPSLEESEHPGSRFGRTLQRKDIPAILFSRPLALRVLIWELKHAPPSAPDSLSFARLFGELQLPYLQHIGLHMNEYSLIPDDTLFMQREILPMLLAPGRSLTSLSLTRTTAAPRNRHTFPFLELCPRLRELAFHLPHTAVYDVSPHLGGPHRGLKKVLAHEFFYNPPEYSPALLAEHAQTVLEAFKALCRLGSFPALESVQLADVFPVSDEARALRAAHGDFPGEYRALMGKLMRLAFVRGVKLLDATGEPVQGDFCAPGWYYAWGWEGLGVSGSV